MSRLWSRSLAMAMVAALLFLAAGIGHLELFADAWVLPVPVQTMRRSLPLPVASPRLETTPALNHQDSPTRTPTASRKVDAPAVSSPTRDTGLATAATPAAVVALPHDPAVGDILVGAPDAITQVHTPDSERSEPANTPAVDPATTDSPSTWDTAAGAGVAIGRGSKAAGVATAGVFTRFARRVAGSF